jgi:hypothetical protein
MKTIADLSVGDQFLFACKFTGADQNGVHLELYGPSAMLAATAAINGAGAMTGSLAAPPDQIPVTIVTGFVPVAEGDILQSADGATFVCMWSQIQPDGTVLWSNSADAKVKYPATGFTIVSHASMLAPVALGTPLPGILE